MLTTRNKKRSAPAAAFSPFLPLVLSLLMTLLAVTSSAAADTTLVANEAEVPIRSGQGTEYKIISLLQNGETVTSLEEDGYWIKVRTARGREGWALKRYLSLPQSIDDAFSLATDTGEQARETSSAAEQKPETIHPEAVLLSENSAPLQPEQATPSLAEQQLAEAGKELEELRDKLALVTLENKELQKNDRIQWFLTGGGVLLIGWIIGLITSRSRRRKPSLL